MRSLRFLLLAMILLATLATVACRTRATATPTPAGRVTITPTTLPPTPTPFITPATTPGIGVTPTGTPVLVATPTGTPAFGVTPTGTPSFPVTPTATPTLGPTPTRQPTLLPTGTPTGTPVAEARLAVAQKDGIGQYLTDGSGKALYIFRFDDKSLSTCYASCADTWPPVITRGTAVAGSGVKANLIGAVERFDNTTQVTYNGWPLYTFTGDQAAGDIKAHKYSNVFFLINPDGKPIDFTEEPAPTGTTTPAAGVTTTPGVTATPTAPRTPTP